MDRPVFVPLIKIGLPDTAMSVLPLGNSVGACSELLQNALLEYVQSNPDSAITSETTETTVSEESLEFLVRL